MKAPRLLTRSLIALAPVMLALSPGFGQSSPDSFNPYFDGSIETVTVQSDGKILVGGGFRVAVSQNRTNLARLFPDGQLDTGFVPRIGMYGRRIVEQPDGKILVGGIYEPIGPIGSARFIVRFEADGAVDGSFDSPLRDMPFALALQEDGKVVAGFQTPPYLARYNADGRTDAGFKGQPDSVVYDLVIQRDGKILAAGYFTKMGGKPHPHLARLNSDGTVDAGFNADVNGVVRRVAEQADGKIVFGGVFDRVNGQACRNLARLNADGTLDPQFRASTDGEVHGVVVQPNGRIVVAGDFTFLNGQVRQRFGRLNWDGSLDATLRAGANAFIRTVALQADGKVLVGGAFTTLGETPRRWLGRVDADATAAPVFLDSSSVRFTAGGAVRFSFFNPADTAFLVRATSDLNAPPASWESLGSAQAIGGGLYQFTDPDAPARPRRFYQLRTP